MDGGLRTVIENKLSSTDWCVGLCLCFDYIHTKYLKQSPDSVFIKQEDENKVSFFVH